MKSLSIVKQDKTNGVHVRSVDIWQGLGYTEHRVVKNIINANKSDFEEFGVLHEIHAKPPTGSIGFKLAGSSHLRRCAASADKSTT